MYEIVNEASLSIVSQYKNTINKLMTTLDKSRIMTWMSTVDLIGNDKVYNICLSCRVRWSVGKTYLKSYGKSTYILAPIKGIVDEKRFESTYSPACSLEEAVSRSVWDSFDDHSYRDSFDDTSVKDLARDFKKEYSVLDPKHIPDVKVVQNSKLCKEIVSKFQEDLSSIADFPIVLGGEKILFRDITDRNNVVPLAVITPEGELDYCYKDYSGNAKKFGTSNRVKIPLSLAMKQGIGNYANTITRYTPFREWTHVPKQNLTYITVKEYGYL